MEEVKFELLALMETKLKGNGKVSWCGANDINHCWYSGDGKGYGWVAILLNDVWHSAGIAFGCVSSRIL